MSSKTIREEFHSLREIQQHYRPRAMLSERGEHQATKVGLDLANQSLSLVRRAVEPTSRSTRRERLGARSRGGRFIRAGSF